MCKLEKFTRLAFCLVATIFLGCNENDVQEVTVNDIQVSYRVYGDGYPLIMITGLTATMDIWDPTVINELSENYKVIIFDNRGMGLTTTGTANFTIQQFADDTAALMVALDIQKAHIFGWSMGTNVALKLILSHPEMVNKLVLYAGDCGGPEVIEPSAEVQNKMLSGDPGQVFSTLFPEDWLAANIDYITDLFSSISTESSTEESLQKQLAAWQAWNESGVCSQLQGITNEVLLLTGDKDVCTPTANSTMLEGLIPDSLLVQLSDGGHGIQYQYPTDFSEAVLSFLNE